MEELVKLLLDNKLSIASIESFTVGEFASSLASYPMISNVYKGSLICYQTIIKEQVLKVDKVLIDKYGVVSNEVALEMAKKGSLLFNSDITISFTGNAGPTAMEHKPVGLFYIAVLFNGQLESYEYQIKGNRAEIKSTAIMEAVKILVKKIKKMKK
jgi:competence/damage-inducible protein CinA C-terminal domain